MMGVLADTGKYEGVVFHRVIDGFMAQTGDVKYGNSNSPDFDLSLAGTGGSDLPNLKAEFSNIAHDRGVISAARSSDPDSANSQFLFSNEAELISEGSLQKSIYKLYYTEKTPELTGVILLIIYI